MSDSDSDSDDDVPIAQRPMKQINSPSDSHSDSSSSDDDDDKPIAQTLNENKNNKKRRDIYEGLDTSSDDEDMPLLPKIKNININTPKNKNQNKKSMSISSMSRSPSSSGRSSSYSSSSSVSPQKKSVNKKKRGIKKSSKRSSSKNKKRFADSDDDDSDDESSSGDDLPIARFKPATIQSPARKKRKLSNGSPQRSSKHSPYKKKSSAPGYIGRECNPVHLYAIKETLEPLEPLTGATKWWETKNDFVVSYAKSDDSKKKVKWNSLDHNGIVFAPPYMAHNIPMRYDGKIIKLSCDQEEIATMFGVMIETDWAQKEKFKKNFMKEFVKILRDKKQKYQYPEIRDLDKCDFRDIFNWYQSKRETEKLKRKESEYKMKVKEEKEKFDSLYGWALVDGVREKVGNYKVEPPGLFRGRGEHPKMGMLKKRILPENIILNIGLNTPIPECPLPDHNWGGVIHDKTVTYIAKWVESINQAHKFVYLGSSSRFKGEHDRNKYEKARVLKTKIDGIRADYTRKLTEKSLLLRQLATSVWMIDILSIRVGNEKDTDESADTVGVCSLRKEHITLLDPIVVSNTNSNDKKDDSDDDSDSEDDDVPVGQLNRIIYKITLDFLGKDSMRYHQTVAVTERIYKNLRTFLNGKNDDMDIFEKIDPNKVNNYLADQMEGLTAKVFRTHNASTTLQDELKKGHHKVCGTITKSSTLSEKIFFYNQCNKQVAILCNHQRTVSKGHAEALEKMDKQIQDLKNIIKEIKEQISIRKGGKSKKSKKKKKK